jgi:hypothetical protein
MERGMNEAAAFATRLKWHALVCCGFTSPLLIASAMFGHAGLLPSLMMIAGLLTLFLAAYILFDAALFWLIASHASEIDGCRAVDDLLARVHLREPPRIARPLAARMAGTNRLLVKLHLAFAIFLALFGLVATYTLWGTI